MKKLTTILAAFLFMAVQMNGQSVPFLNVNADPYSHSMGGATLTLEQNAFTAMNNASAMVFAPNENYDAISYNTWQPDYLNNTNIGVATFFKAGKADKWAFGVSYKTFGYDSYNFTNDKGSKKSYTPAESSFDLSGSYRISENFAAGVNIGTAENEEMTMPAKLEIIKAGDISEIRLTIQEGKFHQVKRMFESQGMKVFYLKRESMGTLKLDENLTVGEYRALTKEELELL